MQCRTTVLWEVMHKTLSFFMIVYIFLNPFFTMFKPQGSILRLVQRVIGSVRLTHFHTLRPRRVNSKFTCAPLAVLVLKRGVVSCNYGGLLSWAETDSINTKLVKSQRCSLFPLFKGRIRCSYTGGFIPLIHSSIMIWEAAFQFYYKHFHERSHITVTNIFGTFIYQN